MDWWKVHRDRDTKETELDISSFDLEKIYDMLTDPHIDQEKRNELGKISYKFINMMKGKEEPPLSIPNFTYPDRKKILANIKKISHSDIKPGMVIALPYNRLLYSENMTDNGIHKKYTSYEDLFIFGVMQIKKNTEYNEYYMTIETYTPYEESCGFERQIVIKQGIVTTLKFGIYDEKIKLAKTLYDSNDYSDQAGPITQYIYFNVFKVPFPEQYLKN
jgi:hypothetical protein